MAQYPTSLPTFTNLDPNTTLAANSHAFRHNKVHDEVTALAAKVGVDSSADTNSHDYKIGALEGEITTLEGEIATLATDKADSTDVASAIATAIAAAKEALYPVGSIYTNAAVATNPGTLLGFGTWVAYASGRVLVGFDSGQTEFDTVEETGGAKTHTLTVAEMPTHSHGLTGTSNGDFMGMVGGGQGGWGIAGGTNNNIYRAIIQNNGGGGAHNNLQPYITVYMWKRTA